MYLFLKRRKILTAEEKISEQREISAIQQRQFTESTVVQDLKDEVRYKF